MHKQVVKTMFYTYLFLFLLAGCGEDNPTDLGLPDVVQEVELSPEVSITPLTAQTAKGTTLTVDVSPSISGITPEADWALENAKDTRGLVTGLSVSKHSLTFKAEIAGLTKIDYQIVYQGKQYTSQLLLAVMDTPRENSPPVAMDISENILNNTTFSIDLNTVISDDDSDTLDIVNFTQTDKRFTLNGALLTYNPDGYIGNDLALYGVVDGNGNVTVGRVLMSASDSNTNSEPVANDLTKTINQKETLVIDISELTSDSDTDPVTLTQLFSTSGRAKITSPTTIEYNSGGYSGNDNFIYAVTDSNGGVVHGKITLNIIPTPKEPLLSLRPLAFNMNVGETTAFDLKPAVNLETWALDSVVDSTGLTTVDATSNYGVTLTALNPGVAKLTYTVSSGDETQTAELLIAVSKANSAPPNTNIIRGETDSITPITVNISGGVSGENVTVSALNQTGKKFELNGSTVTYTPSNFIGTDIASYVVTNEQGEFSTGVIIINVFDANPPIPNNQPTANNGSISTDSNTVAHMDLSLLASDADSTDILEFTLYGGENRASLGGTNNTVLTYSPKGFIGSDEIIYKVSDGHGGVAIGAITITVSDANANNADPIANDLTITVTRNDIINNPANYAPYHIDLSTLISDPDISDTVSITELYQGINPVTMSPSSLSLDYTPSADIDKDVLTYVVSDTKGGVAQGRVTFNITNTAPTALPASMSIDPFNTATPSVSLDLTSIGAGNTVPYVTDAENDALTLSFTNVEAPATLTANGLTLTYTPNGVERIESISYTVNDGHHKTSNVIQIVSGSQGSLTANNVHLGALDMASVATIVDVAPQVTSGLSNPAVISSVFGATRGTTTVNKNSLTFTYTPNDTSYGIDTFYYTVTDNQGHFATAQVDVTINEPIQPTINDIKLDYTGDVTATVSCTECDAARTSYQFKVGNTSVDTNAVSVNPGNLSATYQLVGNEKDSNTIGVLITAKNKYCTTNNTGISGGNACKTAQGTMVIKPVYTKDVYANEHAFAALKSDGSVVTWGGHSSGGDSSLVASKLTSDVTTILGNDSAFAALKADGSVVTWGSQSTGGDSSLVASQLTSGVTKIFATPTSFAALKIDGSVITWGNQSSGGDSSAVASQLTSGVTTIAGNYFAFAALKSDGSVVTWGHQSSGGDSSLVASQLNSDVTKIFNTGYAFAALKADGSVVTWGNSHLGANSSSVASLLTNGVTQIFTTDDGFAALKTDGSVVTWGSTGGDSSSVASLLTNGVTTIVGNNAAFAAIKTDGSVVTWGDDFSGGDSSPMASQLSSGVTKIFAAENAFAALKTDGSVVTWGVQPSGGDSSAVASQLTSGVTEIFATDNAFAALKTDGSVVTWGEHRLGGDSSVVSSNIDHGVTKIYSTSNAFLALKADGSAVTWGNQFEGGDSSSVEFTSKDILYYQY